MSICDVHCKTEIKLNLKIRTDLTLPKWQLYKNMSHLKLILETNKWPPSFDFKQTGYCFTQVTLHAKTILKYDILQSTCI